MPALLLEACAFPSLQAQVVVVLDSGRPGPRVVVVGGQHGDEPSGALAAKALASGPRPRRGMLVVIPEAHPEAMAQGTRLSETIDLNRSYPDGTPLAQAIFAHVREADLVMDLHEAGSAWPETEAPTLVLSPSAAPLALDLLEHLNRQRPTFTYTGGAPSGSLVGELGKRDRPAFVVEVPARWPMNRRITLHRRVIEAALAWLDMR